jgi:hypothetical protein
MCNPSLMLDGLLAEGEQRLQQKKLTKMSEPQKSQLNAG